MAHSNGLRPNGLSVYRGIPFIVCISQSEESSANRLGSKPDWLTMGSDLTPEIVPLTAASELEFRNPYGGAKLFSAPLGRLEVDGVRVESAPAGEQRALRASLNPARNRLIITRSFKPFYVSTEIGEQKVTVDWDNRKPLPAMDYGEPPRFEVSFWIWLDDSTAISPGGIETEDQHNYAQAGLFVFNIDSKTLRRIKLDQLKIGELPILHITGVVPEKRIVRLHLDDDDSTNDRIFLLKIPTD